MAINTKCMVFLYIDYFMLSVRKVVGQWVPLAYEFLLTLFEKKIKILHHIFTGTDIWHAHTPFNMMNLKKV